MDRLLDVEDDALPPARGALEAALVRSLLDDPGHPVHVRDRDGRYLAGSRTLARVYGTTPGGMVGRSDEDFLRDEHAAAAREQHDHVVATGRPVLDPEHHLITRSGDEAWLSVSTLPLRGPDGEVVGTFGIANDASAQVRERDASQERAAAFAMVHDELQATEAQLRAVLELSPDTIVMYDPELRYRYVNPQAAATIGLEPAQIIGRTDEQLGHGDVFRASWEGPLREVLRTGQSLQRELEIVDRDHRTRWFHAWIAPQLGPDGEVTGLLSSARELTALKRAEELVAHRALHDPVTELPNRLLLMDRLAHAVARKTRDPGAIALLLIDLDDFKMINDAHGHEVGDRVLREVGRRLREVSRRIDTVARFGGDEFALLCDGLADDEDVRMVADRIVRALRPPFEDAGQPLHLSGSVGVVVSDDPDADAATLVRDAEAAVRQAKAQGRNRYQYFDPELHERTAARDGLALELRHALERDQLEVHYQPLFSLADRKVVGVEALLRWHHPDRGMVPPGEFIGIAEDRGLIVPIGTWVLDRALAQLAAWSSLRDPHVAPLTLAVNVSAHQLRDPDLVRTVQRALQRHAVDPGRLCLEVTETALIAEGPQTLLALETLTELGVDIALDDFGTGFSSLAHLRTFPVNVLKIDRSFVERLSQHDRDREIVAAVTAMAHVLGMSVVGEGIETESQLGELTQLACDTGQGFLLSRPQPAASVTDLLGGA